MTHRDDRSKDVMEDAVKDVTESALRSLDLDTKARLLAGQDLWTLPAVPAIGLRSLVMSDGPVGVRGTRWTADDPSLAATVKHLRRRRGDR